VALGKSYSCHYTLVYNFLPLLNFRNQFHLVRNDIFFNELGRGLYPMGGGSLTTIGPSFRAKSRVSYVL
jgi:hypothetical protein